MSTRATYGFERDGVKVVCYVHHDGYPEGAAKKFRSQLQSKGIMAEAFIRGNDDAEITEAHEVHGDTEYRYNVVYGFDVCRKPVLMLTAKKRSGDWSSPTWAIFFEGELEFFVAHYQ